MPNTKQYLRDRGHPFSRRTESSLGRKQSPGERKAQHKRAAPAQLASLGPGRWQGPPHGKAQKLKESVEWTTLTKFKTKGGLGKTRKESQTDGRRATPTLPPSEPSVPVCRTDVTLKDGPTWKTWC